MILHHRLLRTASALLVLTVWLACERSEQPPTDPDPEQPMATAAIGTDPGPGPGPDLPTPRCKTCGRDKDRNFICADSDLGANKCPDIDNTNGRSCSFTLSCGLGRAFPGAAIAFQARVNASLHSGVVPALRSCWSSVSGKGDIVFTHRYERDGAGRWLASGVDLYSSSIAEDQTKVALGCMREATRKHSFKAGRNDAKEGEFLLHWIWPVPMPPAGY